MICCTPKFLQPGIEAELKRPSIHNHCSIDEKKQECLCAVIKDVNLTKLAELLKAKPGLLDLEYESLLPCNCKLVSSTSKFKQLEFLTISLTNICPKKEVKYWKNFKNLLYLDIGVPFSYENQLFDIITKLPNLQHLILSDIRALTFKNLPAQAPLNIHTLVLKGSMQEPHNLNLEPFLHVKRFCSTRSDYGVGKFLRQGKAFKHLIAFEIGGLIFEELNDRESLQYLPLAVRYLRIKHILYPDLLKLYLTSLPNLEYLDLQDTFSLNKISDLIPHLTNLQGIFVNTINFADLTEMTIRCIEAAVFRNCFLKFDFSYSDVLKYDENQHKNLASVIAEGNWNRFKNMFHLSDTYVNEKGWEIMVKRENTPSRWLAENEFITKQTCTCCQF